MKFKFVVLLAFALAIISCSKKIVVPSFIKFQTKNDSIIVLAENKLYAPIFINIVDSQTNKIKRLNIGAQREEIIFKFHNATMDSTEIVKRFNFNGKYGRFPFSGYDSSFAYTLPFKKGYKTSIIQGYNGSFSHKGSFSAKCIDFDMKVGDTIVATADGIVVRAVTKYNKQGVTEKFKEYGNYILLYHKNNTFSQYVHLKQNGALVKVGDSVKSSQPIGISGFTGWTTTPHLHFGVYKPAADGLHSIAVILDSIDAKKLKRGMQLKKL